VLMWGGELLLRDGAAAGLVTSAAWGATIGASVGLAYVRHDGGEVVTPDYVRSGRYQVNVGGTVCGARVSLRPPFDPDGEKVHR
jgi:glycine cleavage system aminomethyltransferase T